MRHSVRSCAMAGAASALAPRAAPLVRTARRSTAMAFPPLRGRRRADARASRPVDSRPAEAHLERRRITPGCPLVGAESRPVEPDLGHTSEGSRYGRQRPLPKVHRGSRLPEGAESVTCCRKLGEPASDPPAGTPRPQHHQLRVHGGGGELPAGARRLAGHGPCRGGGRGLSRDRPGPRGQYRHPVAAMGGGDGRARRRGRGRWVAPGCSTRSGPAPRRIARAPRSS